MSHACRGLSHIPKKCPSINSPVLGKLDANKSSFVESLQKNNISLKFKESGYDRMNLCTMCKLCF